MEEAAPGPVYDSIGVGYAGRRRADPRIAQMIWGALKDARTVVNVGAGTGNYEPPDRLVVAMEPSMAMLAQRPASSARVVRGVAEALPFRDKAFDVGMAIWTLHHWTDVAAGLAELRRVAIWTLHHWTDVAAGLAELRRVSRRQLVFQDDVEVGNRFWALDYFPEALDLPSAIRAPTIADIAARLDVWSVLPVPIPADCTDGFMLAYWRRPEAFLDPAVRAGMSILAQLLVEVQERGARRLEQDLRSGAWDARYGHLGELAECDVGVRLVVAGV